MKTVLWWIRRDLRLSDNQALATALHQAVQVLPVFALDPVLLDSAWTGEKRLAFLYAGLRALDHDLRQKGSYLIVRRGDPVKVLADLSRETGAEMVFAEADYSPYARRRDQIVTRALPFHSTPGVTLVPPGTIVKPDESPYTKFTPFRKAWLARARPGDPLPAPGYIPTPAGICSEGLPGSPQSADNAIFPAGESEARRRLETFAGKAIYRYREYRDRMDMTGTSTLSPYLRFGMISIRQAFTAARRASERAGDSPSMRSSKTWLDELVWREFYIAILYYFPSARQTAFRPAFRDLRWINDPEDFAAWKQGRTGYPIIDAAMRQLLHTGWMHNRARMIVASFLTKDLLVDWRWGERHFMQHLIDGDPAANNGGWQWVAGTGTDAAPYFRIFNPVLQSQKFDPAGKYIRRFVPELVEVPDEFIHTPWKMPMALQNKVGCVIGRDYPATIVEHAWARERVQSVYNMKG
jgi:deoxyribodipyrimidine photo-lyase